MEHELSKQLYPPETAGRLMVEKRKVPAVPMGTTLIQVKQLLAAKGRDYETINYIYVTDKKNHLQGVFSIKEFLEHEVSKEKVDDIMKRDVISVKTHTHQERVALLALRHNIKALPVVDKEDVFLGIIPFDVILKILDKEAVQDLLRFGGIYHRGSFDDLIHLPILQSIKHRLPWLLIGLLGGLLAAGIIDGFQETLSRNLILAAFIPLIVYMADAVGTQMEAFIIRDLAINPTLRFLKYFLKQLSIVSLIGIITSAVLALISFALYGNALISMVLGIALFFATISSVVSGLIIPYLFGKLKLDPANASGPIATTLQDVFSVLVYFTVALLIL